MISAPGLSAVTVGHDLKEDILLESNLLANFELNVSAETKGNLSPKSDLRGT